MTGSITLGEVIMSKIMISERERKELKRRLLSLNEEISDLYLCAKENNINLNLNSKSFKK